MNSLAVKVLNETTQHSLLIADAYRELELGGFDNDAIHIVDTTTLLPVNEKTKEVVILMAAFLGSTRLIDNKVILIK